MKAKLTHFLRLGVHSEAEYFQKAKPLYDALILNANLVQATPAASAALVYKLEKPFFIDPFTHAFSLSPQYLMSKSKGKSQVSRIKRSFQGLADMYFSNAAFLGERRLTESDFSISEFTKSVLEYQDNVLASTGAELVNLMGAKPELFKPRWLIAPYFPLRKSLEWLETNISCLHSAIDSEYSERVCAILPVEFGALKAAEGWKTIADRYCDLKPKVIFLWIESFDEDQASEDDLNIYCSFVRRINDKGIKVVNLFGGFFSCLAECVGLSGFAHGLVYGENKSFTPVVGGGQPPPRYYFKTAHIAMNVRGAELLLGSVSPSKYLSEVCGCTICYGLFNAQDDLTHFAQFAEANDQGKFMPRAYALCRYHFLFARDTEIRTMSGLVLGDRIALIQENITFLRDIGADNYAEHLATWINVINTNCALN